MLCIDLSSIIVCGCFKDKLTEEIQTSKKINIIAKHF